MLLLSKYTVLEYLLWLKTNNFSDCGVSLNQWESIKVMEVESGTQNFVFEFSINSEKYIIKQFRLNLSERKPYFVSEREALNLKMTFAPTLVFCDELNQVIITKKIPSQEPISRVIRRNNTDDNIKMVICDIALKLVEIHQKLNLHTYSKNQKFPLGKWEDKIKSNYNVSSLLADFQRIWKQEPWGLIHHDLNGANVLVDNKSLDISIIDWEMSEIGHPYFDLCAIIRIICLCYHSDNPFGLSTPPTTDTGWTKTKEFANYFLECYGFVGNKDDLKVIFKALYSDLYRIPHFFNVVDDLFN
jgi:hypothetical protein